MREYNNFLNDNFNGLTLKSPLFYNWDASLRFDLQPHVENSVRPDMSEYFETVLHRSTQIFESVFSSDDEILIVLYQFKWPSRKKIKLSNFVFKQITDINKSDVNFSLVKSLYDNDDKWNRALIKTKVANLKYKELLKAISHSDFPSKKPSIQFETYIINITKNIIFHMYDDRGLDVLVSNKKTLVPIYHEHKDWLLDYDIEMMQERLKDVL